MKCNFCGCENMYNVCDECYERILKMHILNTDNELRKKNNSLVIINILKFISLIALFAFPPSWIYVKFLDTNFRVFLKLFNY